MAKDAFDMLAETVNESNKVLLSLVKQTAAHGVWIKIFSAILMAAITAIVRLWIKIP